MPIYEYKCSKCGKVSEILEGVGSTKGQIKCRHCGSSNLEKMLSVPAAVIMKDDSKAYDNDSGCCGMTNPCDDPKRCCTR